jgi:hypothetical protein
MLPKPPLLRLVIGNLQDAVRLGLIENLAGQVDEFRERTELGWSTSTALDDQLNHFRGVVNDAQFELDALHRPRRSPYLRDRTIATVMTLGQFANKFENEVAAPKTSDSLKSLLGKPTSDTTAQALAHRNCLDFSARFSSTASSGGGSKIRAAVVGVGAGRHTWVALPPGRRISDKAQYWRDRLGLIHITRAPTPLIDHMLVRVEFQVTPSRAPLDRKDWKGTRTRHPTGLWVIRPTMVHGGNQRFVQAHNGDDRVLRGSPSHGMTRDLSSAHFSPGEREMLMICGRDAEIHFRSLTLLKGVAGELPARENGSDHFVEKMSAERGWS